MPGQINIVPVSFTNPADQVAVAAAQQDMQRRQALADELRRQSLQETPSNGGRISWTQGMARIAQALAANRMNRENQAQSWDLLARQANAQAAMHDPSGSAVPQIDPSTNPYTASEQGRNVGQRIGDFIRGGPPVDRKALAAALRAHGTTDPQPAAPPADSGGSAGDGFDARAAADGGPPQQDPQALAAGIRAAAKGTTSLTPTGPTTALPNSDAASAGMPLNPTMNAGGPAATPAPDPKALAAGVRASAGLPPVPASQGSLPASGGNAQPPSPSFGASMQQTLGSLTPEDGSTSPYSAYAAQPGGGAPAPNRANPRGRLSRWRAPSVAQNIPDRAFGARVGPCPVLGRTITPVSVSVLGERRRRAAPVGSSVRAHGGHGGKER